MYISNVCTCSYTVIWLQAIVLGQVEMLWYISYTTQQICSNLLRLIEPEHVLFSSSWPGQHFCTLGQGISVCLNDISNMLVNQGSVHPCIHENSVGLFSTTNPKPKGQPSISLPAQANLTGPAKGHDASFSMNYEPSFLQIWPSLCTIMMSVQMMLSI